MIHFDKPAEGEYAPYAIQYIALIPDGGALLTYLQETYDSAKAFFLSVPEEKLTSRYAEGKWTVKEILAHIIDTERIYAYRALRFSRNDETALAGFDQDSYVKFSHANERSLGDMLEELAAVRAATIALLKSFDADAMVRGGVANGRRMTVRAAAYILAGHQVHHVNIIKERYL